MYTANRLSRLCSSSSKLVGGGLRQWARIFLSSLLVVLAMFGTSLIEARRGDNGGKSVTGDMETARLSAVPAAVITVNSLADVQANNGQCTLREAILNANGNNQSGSTDCTAGSGSDTIEFNVGAGTPTINLTSALPTITGPVTIKGNTGGATRVELNGAGAGASSNGLTITGGNSTILRLVINRFGGNGISISGTGFNTIKGCLIGTNAAGTAASANGVGVKILGSSDHVIGGSIVGDRNLISGNTGAGVLISYDSGSSLAASRNQVIGNFIGTDANGKLAIGNGGLGVDIVGGNLSTIGGVTEETRNIISGNSGGGIKISTTNATGNVIIGNYIGSDTASLAPIGNGGIGVLVDGSPNNRIGGVGIPCPNDNTKTCSEGNTIRFNNGKGVVIKTDTAIGNSILSNLISENNGLGIDLAENGASLHGAPGAPTNATATAGNAQATVSFCPPASNGGSVIYAYTVTSSPGGLTASGGSSPITVTGLTNGTAYTFTVTATNIIGTGPASAASNSVTPTAPPPFTDSNSLSSTATAVCPALNPGPNSLQNSPVVSGVSVVAGDGTPNNLGSSTINGYLYSSASTDFRIELFLNPLCDSSGSGEGKVPIGSINVTTAPFIFNNNTSGLATFSKALNYALPGGYYVTATATRLSSGTPVETSEFSSCKIIPFTSSGCDKQTNVIPGVQNFSAAAGSSAYYVTFPALFCPPASASTTDNWINIASSGISSIGDSRSLQTLTISVSANTGTARFGKVTINGVDYTISQDAPCTASINPFAATFADQAASGTFNLYIPAGCPWTITNPTTFFPWITVTTQSSGSGPTVIDFSLAANPGPSERTGFIMVGGQTYVIAQDAPCTAHLNPTSKSFAAAGGSDMFSLTVGNMCSWTAMTTDPWITITSTTNGMGGATVNYTVAANTGSVRSGTISIAGKAFAVNQDAYCPATISPSSQSFTSTAGTGHFDVSIGPSCMWQATTNDSWITITSGASGTGNGMVNFSVAANSGGQRNGTITVAGQTFQVQQLSSCVYDVSPTLQGIVAGGGTGTASVMVGMNCAWTATASVPWITITSGSSGSGDGTITYSVTTNGTGAQRAGQINVADKSLVITQDAGCTFTVSPTSQNVAAAGVVGNMVNVTAAANCPWQASSNDSWIVITSSLISPKDDRQARLIPADKNSTAGNGNGAVTYNVLANTGPPRTGTMFVAGELVTINQASGCPINISPANLNAGQVGVNYSQQLTQSGGTGGINWTISSGSLPLGLTLNQTSGLLSGTPTLPGTFSFTARATDANSCYGEVPYMLVINCQTLSITPTTLPNGTAGTTYNQALTLNGGSGSINWTISAGSLPAGVTINPGTGVLSGIPTATGTFNFTAKATVVSTGCFATQALSMTIGCQTITVNEASLAVANFNTSYSQTVTQTGGIGNISWTVSVGSLPTNLTLSTSGLISGIPNTIGSFPVTLRATDANGCFGEKAFTLTVSCQSFTITPASLNQGTVNVGYSQQLSQTGATNSVTWSLFNSSLPTNLTLSSGGLISGTPNVAGSFPITVRATESGTGCFTDKAYTLVINCQTISLSPTSLPGGTVGSAYSQTVSQSGGVGTITWSVSAGSLPNGLGLGSTTGTVSGLPTVSGTFNFTIRATDGNNCFGERAYQVVIGCSGLSISPSTLNSAPIVTAYSQQLTLTGGSGATAWTITTGTLPSGITLNPTTGLLSGLPNESGTFNFTVKALVNSSGCFAQQAYSLVITCPTITVAPTTISNGNMGVPYSQQFTQTGAAFNLSWSLSSGSLPNGLTLSTSGLLAGTPTMSGNYPITVRATDGNLCFGERAYTLQIGMCSSISITPNTLPNGLINTNYNQTLTATGGTPGYSFAVTNGALPNGVTLSASGALTGMPTVVGAFSFTVTATDQAGCTGIKVYTLQICGVISVNPATLPSGTKGLNYNQTLTAAGGVASYSFSSSGTLPPGLTLTSAGVLSGIPNASGSFSFTVTAMDANTCTGSRSYTLVIGEGLMFYPLAHPIRLLDTRAGATVGCDLPGQPITGGTSRTQTVAGRTCDGISIPASAKALAGNITTIGSGGGYLTLYPSDTMQPTVANSNYLPNEIVNNVFTVGLGASDGAFKIFVTSNTHLVVDVTGYYAPPGAGGLYFHPLPSPIRLLETRAGQPGCNTTGTPLVGGAVRAQQARINCGGVTIPANAAAIVGNATVVGPGGLGYLTLYPGGVARPLVASSNYGAGQIVNAPFTVGLASDGVFNIYSTNNTDLVVDVLGYYSPDAVDVNGNGLLFNSLPRPVRLLETRAGYSGCYALGTPLGAGSTRVQQARGVCDGMTIAATAQAIVGNATVVVPSGGGWLTFWPSDAAAQPVVAASNYLAGQVFNRHFTVGLGADGAFKIFTFATTDLVIDVSGYFAP